MMKKLVLTTVVAAFALCPPLAAQTLNVGVTGGLNVSTPTGYQSKTGFHVGVQGELSLPTLSDGLYLTFGARLSSLGWKARDKFLPKYQFTFAFETTPYYLNIPVHLGYKWNCGNGLKVFANAGPYVNIGLFGNTKERYKDDAGKTQGTYSTVKPFSFYNITRFNWGVGAQLGVEFNRHYQLSAGYDQGFNNIYQNAHKNRTFMLSATYMF